MVKKLINTYFGMFWQEEICPYMGKKVCFGDFSTSDLLAMESGYSKLILLLPKHAKTCSYKGKAFLGDFSTFDHVGYGNWLF